MGPGSAGAARTPAALASLPPSWSTVRLAEPRWPHVVGIAVGPGGVFVVGSCQGSPESARQIVLSELSAATEQVITRCGVPPDLVRPVLCLDGGSALEDAGGVHVCRPEDLVRTLTERPAQLSPAGVAGAAIRLDAWLRTAAGRGVPKPGAAPGQGTAWRARTAVQVILALLLILALLVAGARVAYRSGDALSGSSGSAPFVQTSAPGSIAALPG